MNRDAKPWLAPSSQNHIGSVDPDALKNSRPQGGILTSGERPFSFHAEPTHNVEQAILVLERLAAGRGRPRGKTAKSMTQVKRRARPPGTKNKPGLLLRY